MKAYDKTRITIAEINVKRPKSKYVEMGYTGVLISP